MSRCVDNYRLKFGSQLYVPIIVGGMGVDISTAELALEAARLGGIGHISDAMSMFVSDKNYGTSFSKQKSKLHRSSSDSIDKTNVVFDLDHVREAQLNHVRNAMDKKKGSGGIFVNVMEKLTMNDGKDTLQSRLVGALEGGIDGITLSAGLHKNSLNLMKDHPRFRDVKVGIIVSSVRALKIFLRSAKRVDRLPDYVVVEGPLAGGHLGFGEDWKSYNLKIITQEVLDFMKENDLPIPVVPAGGIFTGTDATEYLEMGASAVQVATRFTITEECGLPANAKQAYFGAKEEDIKVQDISPTGYLIRYLEESPCIGSNIKPQCEVFGYILSPEGRCQYIDAYDATGFDDKGKKLPVMNKVCLCHHFSKFNCWTCGHYVYRLKDTSVQHDDGSYQLLSAENVFTDYQFSTDHEISTIKNLNK